MNHEQNEPDSADYWPVVVVGAGAAGLMAAIRAAEGGCRTLLLEKNRRPGIKILMSGGTRCNITQATDNRGIVEAFGPAGRFLHSSLAALSVDQSIEFFEQEGVATKVEETGKIFPISNKAADVLGALVGRLNRSGAQLALQEPLEKLHPESMAAAATIGGFLLATSRRRLHARTLIVTSGGQSYPGSGTTGDGYRWAADLGHTIVPPRPALVPLTVEAPWVRALKGITVPDVALQVVEPSASVPYEGQIAPAEKPRVLAARRGSLLFTHFGLSGPVVLDVSRAFSAAERPGSLALVMDFLPELTTTTLDDLMSQQSAAAGKKSLIAALPEHLPRRLVETVLALAGLPADRRMAEIGRRDRTLVCGFFKRLLIPVSGTLGFKKAEVTAGGIALAEVDSKTLESKLVKNLFLAGEVLDLDGPIGGYNFQAAWSTGWLAGQSACQRAMETDD